MKRKPDTSPIRGATSSRRLTEESQPAQRYPLPPDKQLQPTIRFILPTSGKSPIRSKSKAATEEPQSSQSSTDISVQQATQRQTLSAENRCPSLGAVSCPITDVDTEFRQVLSPLPSEGESESETGDTNNVDKTNGSAHSDSSSDADSDKECDSVRFSDDDTPDIETLPDPTELTFVQVPEGVKFKSVRFPEEAVMLYDLYRAGKTQIIKKQFVSRGRTYDYGFFDASVHSKFVCLACWSVVRHLNGPFYEHLKKCNIPSNNATGRVLPPADRRKLDRFYIEAAMKDKTPLTAFHKPGATKLLQATADMAYQLGLSDGTAGQPKTAFDVENNRSSPANLRVIIKKTVENNRSAFYNKVSGLCSQGCALVTDMTTKNHHFISYVLIYMSPTFEMHKVKLRLDKFDGGANADGILDHAQKELQKLGLTVSDVTIVADGCATNHSAFDDTEMVTCACHLVNTVAKKTKKPYAYVKLSAEAVEAVEKLQKVTNGAQQVITFVRARPSLLNSLDNRLINYVEVRFLSMYSSMERFAALTPRERLLIRSHMLQDSKVLQFFKHAEMGIPLLKSYLHLLEPMYSAVRVFESDSTITLHKVARTYRKLEQHFLYHLDHPEASPFIRGLSEVLLKSLRRNEKYFLQYIHYVAAALDPYLDKRCLRTIFDDKAESYRVRLIKEASDLTPLKPANFNHDLAHEFGGPQTSVNSVSSSIFEYFGTEFSDKTTIAEWWNCNQGRYPELAKIARKTFCVPASSSSCERMFSELKSIFGLTRHRLLPANINDYIILNEMHRILETVNYT